jgi:hypothetical protein
MLPCGQRNARLKKNGERGTEKGTVKFGKGKRGENENRNQELEPEPGSSSRPGTKSQEATCGTTWKKPECRAPPGARRQAPAAGGKGPAARPGALKKKKTPRSTEVGGCFFWELLAQKSTLSCFSPHPGPHVSCSLQQMAMHCHKYITAQTNPQPGPIYQRKPSQKPVPVGTVQGTQGSAGAGRIITPFPVPLWSVAWRLAATGISYLPQPAPTALPFASGFGPW